MKVDVKKDGACRKVLRVEVGQDVVDAELAKVAGEYARAVRVPGFRKGKAPTNVVHRTHAKDISEETRNRLVPRCYGEALDSEKIEPIAVVGVHDVSMGDGNGLSFTVEVDTLSKFKLPKYKGMPLKKNVVEVNESQVDDAVRELREQASSFEEVTDRPVAEGDMVRVDYTGTCEDKPIGELVPDSSTLSTATDFWLMLGERELVPGMSQGLIGSSIGDTVSVDVMFPGDYGVKQLAGKAALYSVKTKAIREKKLAELDTEFFERLQVDSVVALRERVREQLQSAAEEREKQRLIGEVADRLLEKTSIDVPKSVVDQETRRIVQDVVTRNAARGVPQDEIEKSREDILSAAAKSSEGRVKLGYILDGIAEAESIEATDADLDARLADMAGRYQMEKDAFRKELEKRDGLATVRRNLRADKTLDYLLGHAKMKKSRNAGRK